MRAKRVLLEVVVGVSLHASSHRWVAVHYTPTFLVDHALSQLIWLDLSNQRVGLWTRQVEVALGSGVG